MKTKLLALLLVLIGVSINVRGQEDCTSLIVNPSLDGTDGWTLDHSKGSVTGNYGCIEAWSSSPFTFDIYQSIKGVKNGIYTVKVQGFYRGSTSSDAQLYANNLSTPLMSIYDCAQQTQSSAFTKSTPSGYTPNDMYSASQAFSLGYYSNNALIFRVTDGTIRLGIKNNKYASPEWTIFDNFKLYYNGALDGYYTLNYMVDGKLYATYEVKAGDKLPFVNNPEKNEYHFIEWEAEGYDQMPEAMPARDFVVDAVFERYINPYIVNPNLEGTDGWTLEHKKTGTNTDGSSGSYSLYGDGNCIEAFNTSFDIYQIMTGVKNGVYTATVQGFYREGDRASANRINGVEEINAFLYANNSSTPLMSIFDCAQSTQSYAFSTSTPTGYMPNQMLEANEAFALGYYSDNSVTFKVTDGTIRLGIKSDNVVYADWTILDNFKLRYDGPWNGDYSITYKVDGKVYASYSLKEEDKIPSVESPEKDGYTFEGWKIQGYDKMPTNMPANYLVATAVFEKKYDSNDRTSLIVNPGLDGNDGWRETNNRCSYGAGCVEGYSNNFDFYQNINGVKNGIYTATVQGFYREGGGPYRADPTTRINGTEKINAFLYANDSSTPLMSIFDCAQTRQSDAFCESTTIGYVPTSMSSASEAFSSGYYSNNTVIFRVTDKKVTLGIRNNNSITGDWTIFDNFKLYYNGPLGYNVLNYMVNGELYASFNLNEGDAIPSVENPQKEGYKFIGWEAQGYDQLPKTMPANDIIINAVLEKLVDSKDATALITEVEKYESSEIPASVLNEMAVAKEAFLAYESETNYKALILALAKVKQWSEAYSSAKAYLNRMAEALESTNFYTDETYEQYYNQWLTKYINKTLTMEEASSLTEDMAWSASWHSTNNIDDVLLSCWTIGGKKCKDYDTSLYINTWSVEGNTDGSEFKTPFFEYFNNNSALNASILQATIKNLVPNSQYSVSLWARLRSTGTNNIKNGSISMQVGNGDKVSLTTGENVKNTNFYIGHFVASGSTDASGVLKLTITVNSGSNVNWLSFKDVYYYKENTKLVVNLPEDAKDGRYDNMYIEVQNNDNNQINKCLISNRTSYTFSNLTVNTEYNVYVKNETGDILGKKEKVKVNEEDVTVTFDELIQPKTLTAKVLTPEGNDVTENSTITWLKTDGSVLSTGSSLKGLIEGTKLICHISLQQSLALQYNTPEDLNYTVKTTDNTISIRLKPFDVISLSGKVFDSNTRQQIPYASVTVSQLLNDKNTKSFNVQTNNEGVYTINAFNTNSSITFSANNYLSKTLEFDSFTNSKIDDVYLDAITGSVVSVNLTYTPSAEDGQTPSTQEWYIDEANVTYSIINQTQNKEITNYTIQNGYIIILEDIQEGDVLEITAHSKTDMFSDVTVTTSLDNKNHANVTIPIMELGSLQASYTKSNNNSVVGILYDNDGVLLRKSLYEGNTMTMSDIPDGNYTLVTMGHSTFFNSILNLSELKNTGLSEGKDYVKNKVSISSGQITKLNINNVPTFDESKFYYTDENTAFTSNKSKVTVGNYITLRANIGFKKEYASDVSDIKLIVDLPESCSFVENSLLIGNKQSTYSLSNNRVVVDLNQQDDNVLFCLIPTSGGTYKPNAFVQFNYIGKAIQQPIGSAYFLADNMSISVPAQSSESTVVVSGIAPSNSEVKIYDGNVLVGQTRSISNGSWKSSVNLYKPYSHSFHEIYAEIRNDNGLSFTTETKILEYDNNYTQPKSITMLYNGNTIVFDLIDGTLKPNNYMYVPGTSDFTFLVQFTQNDPDIIKNLEFKVLASDGTVRRIPGSFNSKYNAWVGKSSYENSNRIPVNVSVEFVNTEKSTIYDNQQESYFQETLNESLGEIERAYSDGLIDILNFTDESCTFSMLPDGYNTEEYYTLTMLNYNEITAIYSNQDYYSIKNDTTDVCFLEEYENNEVSAVIVWDNLECKAIKLSFNINNRSDTVNKHHIVPLLLSAGFSVATAVGEYYLKLPEIQSWYYTVQSQRGFWSKRQNDLVKLLNATCKDGNLKINNSSVYNNLYMRIYDWSHKTNLYLDNFQKVIEEEQRRLKALCTMKGAIGVAVSAGTSIITTIGSAVGSTITNSMNWTVSTFENISTDVATTAIMETGGQVISGITGNELDSRNNDLKIDISKWFDKEVKNVTNDYCDIANSIKASYSSCKNDDDDDDGYYDDDDDDDNDNNDKPHYPAPPLKPTVRQPTYDPSGYVFESVPSNRLEGVKATVYYMETNEDVNGVKQNVPTFWNAEEYEQNNPLFTDENGIYFWDVPQGLWQVKFEKEGYETTYSDWLPVPPPQLDINIGMVQVKKPEVKKVHGYMDGVEVEFDKYMIPELLNTDNIMVSQNGKTVEGKIVLLNGESAYNDENIKYASKLRFVPLTPFNASEVTLTILNNVKSYAGLTMEENFQQTIDVELEMTSIETESDIDLTCEEEYVLTVTVLPAAASKGKTIYVKTSSPMIAAVEKESYVLDKDGKAEIKVTGDLPGSASLFYTIDGYDLTSTTNVRVNFAVPVFLPLPFASVISGTSMYRGTEIELFSSNQDLKIWYTTDGSCPCDENGTRKEYTGPITIKEDVVIKAITENADGETSEVASFNYTILKNNSGLKLNEEWQWVSFNMQNDVLNDVNKALASGTWTDNDEIKNMRYSDSYSSQNKKWFGTLSLHGNINNSSMYKIHSSSAQTLNITGEAVNPNNVSISLGPNWNYISYLPMTAMSIEEAFADYDAQENDMIKSQDAFAIYSETNGWTGNLKQLRPGEGYMMKRGENAPTTSFHYPSLYSSTTNIEIKPRNGIHRYSGNMNIIGKVVYDDLTEGDSIIAIVNGEMRGRCAVNKDDIVFMTIEGDNSSDVSIAIVRDGEIVSTANNRIKYVNDEVIGSLSNPTEIQFMQSDDVNGIQTYPNIVEDYFNVSINLSDIHSVSINIYSLNGLKVFDSQDNNLSTNQYHKSINLSNISAGVYIVNITVNNESHIVRIIKK